MTCTSKERQTPTESCTVFLARKKHSLPAKFAPYKRERKLPCTIDMIRLFCFAHFILILFNCAHCDEQWPQPDTMHLLFVISITLPSCKYRIYNSKSVARVKKINVCKNAIQLILAGFFQKCVWNKIMYVDLLKTDVQHIMMLIKLFINEKTIFLLLLYFYIKKNSS